MKMRSSRQWLAGSIGALVLCSACAMGPKYPGVELVDVIKKAHSTPEERLEGLLAALNRGADVNGNDGDGNTPLMHAVSADDLASVALLVEHGANVNAVNIRGQSPISIAAADRNWDLVRMLNGKGAHLDTRNNAGETLLYVAAKRGDLDAVQRLIQMGATLNVRGSSTLIGAAASGNLELVKVLVDKENADVNHVEGDSLSALSAAAGQGHLDVVEFLVDSGADINSGSGTPLWVASASGRLDVVRFLIENGAALYQSSIGRSPLAYQTALNGHESVLVYLVARGAQFPDFDPEADLYATALINRVFANHLMGNNKRRDALSHYNVAKDYYEKASLYYTEMGDRLSWNQKKKEIQRVLAIAAYGALAEVSSHYQAKLQAKEWSDISTLKMASEKGISPMSPAMISFREDSYNAAYEEQYRTHYEKAMGNLLKEGAFNDSKDSESTVDEVKVCFYLAQKAKAAATACNAIISCIEAGTDEEAIQRCLSSEQR